MKIFVSILDAKGKLQTFQLRVRPITIGRSPESNVIVEDELVSLQHLSIYQSDNGIFIKDLKSKNGLFINGIKVFEQRLYLGDRVKFGDSELYFAENKLEPEVKTFLSNPNPNRSRELALEIETHNEKSIRISKGKSRKSNNDFVKNSKLYAGVESKHNNVVKMKEVNNKFKIIFEYLALSVDIFIAIIVTIIPFYLLKTFQAEFYQKIFNNQLGFSAYFSGDALYMTLAFIIMGFIFFKWNRGKKRSSIGAKIFRID